MIIGLASPRVACSLGDGLERVRRLLAEASARGAQIVRFPEAYLPGLRGQDFDVLPFDRAAERRVVEAGADWARMYRVAAILGMERLTHAGRQIAACVIDADGRVQGARDTRQVI